MRVEHKEKIYNECSAYLVAFEHFTCAAIMINKDSFIIDYNISAAKLFFNGLSFQKNSEKKLPVDLLWIQEELKEVISDDVPHECTHLIVQEHKELLFNIKIKSLKDINRELFGYVILLNDISEVELAKEKYKDVQEVMIAQSRHAAIGEMIAMIAHHWRQPLSVISMGVNNMLLDMELGEFEQESAQNYLQEILEQSEYLSNTINDFSNFFKPQKEKQNIKIGDIIDEAYHILATDLEKNGVSVAITNNSSQAINLHAKELLQVVLNILTNADEAFSAKEITDKKISILVEDRSDSILICLCDNAGGIPKEMQEKIFDPYVSSKEALIGTGLGLYVSKIIVQKHLKGRIWFENKDDGVCFYIDLPANQKD